MKRKTMPVDRGGALLALAAGCLGAFVQYLADRDLGRRRRHVLADKASKTVRHALHRSVRYAHFAAGRGHGLAEHALHLSYPDNPDPDDNTLRDRITSELFRHHDIEKGSLNINVAYGVVELRGEIPDPDVSALIAERVRCIPGVIAIHNYLHLPGVPAPNKARALMVRA